MLETEIAETLKSLDPLRAKAFERAIHELLVVVRPEAKADKPTPPPAVDAKGWPLVIGKNSRVAGRILSLPPCGSST